ncbi:MAG: TolC family protein [bacterium]|nr:TolC family protein [bacterium]
MRFHVILLGFFLTISLSAQNYLVNPATRTSSDGTEILEAPTFGSPSYFKTHFAAPRTRVELMAPARLEDFVVDGHLELSLRGYLELVLENNTSVQIQKLTIETPKNAITRALGRFDPSVVTTFRSTRTINPTTSELEGAATLSRLTQPLSMDYQQTLDTGSRYSIGFSGNKSTTNSEFSTVNPSINASLDFSFTQPLIRDFGREVNRIPIMLAQSRLKISHFNLEEQLLTLVMRAEQAYWSVIDARENLRVSREALGLADAFLKRAERELELGAISELDIYQPQQNRARQEILVTQAVYRLEQQYDALRRQISADIDPDFRDMPIVLTELVLPPTDEETVDPEQMVEMAYRRRPDLQVDLENLYMDDLDYKAAKNQLRPDLSLSVNYSSSGVGGNVSEFGGQGNNRFLLRTIPGGIGDAVDQLFGFDFPTYGFALTLRLPIRDRRSIADLADVSVSKKLNALRTRLTQQQIRLDVLDAVNSVESSKARVKLAQTSLDFSQKRLDGEQMKYDLGVTTIFFLLDAQNALAEAQAELVTQAAQYRRSVTTLLRVTGQLLTERGVVIQ